jgi:hypothetical protein
MGSTSSTARPAFVRAPELLAAETKLLEAQAHVQCAEAEATRKRGDAEAEATRKRGDAEAESMRAEAEATRKRGDAEAESMRAEAMRRVAPYALGISLAALLAVDFYRHESPNYIRRRMLATLRASRAPTTPLARQPVASQLLPVSQSRLVLGYLPTMLLGPTGSGKSTLLSTVARESAALKAGTHAATPMVFVRMRLPSTQALSPEGVALDSTTSLADAHKQIDSLAHQVFQQIGYPTRRAILIRVPEALKMKFGGGSDGGLLADFSSPTSRRLCDALCCLFEVSEELCNERRQRKDVSPEEAAPVLLLDEVQDLIKVSRLASVGGRAVFDTLANLLVMYCVDRRVLRAAVAGSSALLSVEFDRTVASGSRWRYYELRDPEKSAVLDALRVSGYTKSDADELVALCGTRLRLLEPALLYGASAVSARELITSSVDMATRHYRDLFRQLSDVEKGVLSRVLDQAECAEASGQATHASAPLLSHEVTEALVARVSKVLYLRLDGSLTFQSALHRTVWSQLRDECAAA